jgi:hypothetical protein
MLNEKSNTALISSIIISLVFLLAEVNEILVCNFDKTNEFVGINIYLNLGTVYAKVSYHNILLNIQAITINQNWVINNKISINFFITALDFYKFRSILFNKACQNFF